MVQWFTFLAHMRPQTDFWIREKKGGVERGNGREEEERQGDERGRDGSRGRKKKVRRGRKGGQRKGEEMLKRTMMVNFHCQCHWIQNQPGVSVREFLDQADIERPSLNVGDAAFHGLGFGTLFSLLFNGECGPEYLLFSLFPESSRAMTVGSRHYYHAFPPQ